MVVRDLKWPLYSLILAVCFTGCSLGPDYHRPQIDLPTTFREQSSQPGKIADLPWRQLFTDPKLVNLIDTALRNNKDLLQGAARIAEARAVLGFTRADQFPRLDLNGSARRSDSSEQVNGIPSAPRNDFNIGTDLSFEIDLWGKLRRATEAERAELLAVEQNQRSIQISLIAQVAVTYFQLIDQDMRLLISRRTLENRRDTLKNISEQYHGGIVGEIDFRQAEIEEADVEAQVLSLERQLRTSENALAVLLGQTSAPIDHSKSLEIELAYENLPTDLPQSLIEFRPDVLAAEAALAAETARIGIAEAQRLPSLNLSGFIGLESRQASDLLEGNAWSFGADLAGPLLNFRKNLSNVEIYEARTGQALYSYEKAILTAVREVEDSLIAIRTFRAEHQARVRQRDSAGAAAKLAHQRYAQGLTSYLEVLDSERSLFGAELAVSQTSERYSSSVVQLYKALGGGWSEPLSNQGDGSKTKVAR